MQSAVRPRTTERLKDAIALRPNAGAAARRILPHTALTACFCRSRDFLGYSHFWASYESRSAGPLQASAASMQAALKQFLAAFAYSGCSNASRQAQPPVHAALGGLAIHFPESRACHRGRRTGVSYHFAASPKAGYVSALLSSTDLLKGQIENRQCLVFVPRTTVILYPWFPVVHPVRCSSSG